MASKVGVPLLKRQISENLCMLKVNITYVAMLILGHFLEYLPFKLLNIYAAILFFSKCSTMT